MANFNYLNTTKLITELQRILDVNLGRVVRGLSPATLTAYEIQALIYHLKQLEQYEGEE